MGCWNKTCGLSGLHILAGTPVYVFVLEKNEDDSNCYSTSLFAPLMLPFESFYNDYGGGEYSSGICFDLVMNGIKERLVEMPIGENECHDIPVTKEGFGEKLFFDSIHEGRLFVTVAGGKTAPVSFTMFRKDIVDDILENYGYEDYVGYGKGNTGWENSYNLVKFSDIVSSVRPMLEDLSEQFRKMERDSERFYLLDSISSMRKKYLSARWLGIFESYRFSGLVNFNRVLLEEIQKESLDDLEVIVTAMLKAQYIEMFMNHTRKTWIPGGHEGSQSAESRGYRFLCNSMINVLDREEKDSEDWDEGEEDDV